MQALFPQREGATGGYRRINALGLYTQTHLRVFYRFVRFFILPIVLFSRLLSDIHVYVLCCNVSPTSLFKMGVFTWIFFSSEMRVSKSEHHVEEGGLT